MIFLNLLLFPLLIHQSSLVIQVSPSLNVHKFWDQTTPKSNILSGVFPASTHTTFIIYYFPKNNHASSILYFSSLPSSLEILEISFLGQNHSMKFEFQLAFHSDTVDAFLQQCPSNQLMMTDYNSSNEDPQQRKTNLSSIDMSLQFLGHYITKLNLKLEKHSQFQQPKFLQIFKCYQMTDVTILDVRWLPHKQS